jgi:predicted DNA-binding transcriptional regulator YafY
MEFGKPMAVKVRFCDRAHTLDKLKKDVAHRSSCRLRKEQDTSWIMEDIIIGQNEFITWLLGFGSAAEVLEPQELRMKIQERVRQALSLYMQEEDS